MVGKPPTVVTGIKFSFRVVDYTSVVETRRPTPSPSVKYVTDEEGRNVGK